jgi:hypothetical protein
MSENYGEEYPDFKWIWNKNIVSSFDLISKCDDAKIAFLGGPNNFGDGDTLTKFIKFNDHNIFKEFQPKGYPFYYVPITNYKIDFGIYLTNWNSTYAKLSIATASKSNPLELSFQSNELLTCKFKDFIYYTDNSFIYSSLTDEPQSANITFIASPMPSRKENNFGLSYFKFYFSPCHKTCLTCSTPEFNACNTCRDSNSILENGKCICKENYIRDFDDPLNPCIPIDILSIINNGIINQNNTESSTILFNRIQSASYYCQNERSLIGGFIDLNSLEENDDTYINILNYNIESIFYKVKISLELITENEESLSFPFKIYTNNSTLVNNYDTKKIKYLVMDDESSLSNCFTGIKEPNLYKIYKLSFFVYTNSQNFYLNIKNNFNLFWGIHSLDYKFLRCHENCLKCTGPKSDDCTKCKYGMELKSFNNNEKLKKGSCTCDGNNGFVKVSNFNSTSLNCVQKKINFINTFYINDLDDENFEPEYWKNEKNILTNKNIITCENKKILGNYNLDKYNYLETTIDLNQKIPNFIYNNFEASFVITFINTISNFAIKVFLDNDYIWGNLNLKTTIGEEIKCNSDTSFYQKEIKFTYYNNDYFTNSMKNRINPKLRIQVFPESECLFNSKCGWGLNNFEIKVNRNDIDKFKICNFRPFIDCPCDSTANKCNCFPGYYSFKSISDDFICLSNINNFNLLNYFKAVIQIAMNAQVLQNAPNVFTAILC